MTKLTPAQVAQVAAAAGFKGAALTKAVAVALAESGGDTQAVNVNRDKHRSRDRGLWQINNYWHKEVSDAQAFNPASAAAAAYQISRGGTDWSQWSSWKNGAAAVQMGRAQLAAGAASQEAAQRPAGWVPDWLEDKLKNPSPPSVIPGPLPGLPPGVPGLPGIPDLPGVPDIPGVPSSPGDVVGNVQDQLAVMKQAMVLAIRGGAWISDPHNWARVGLVVGGGYAVLLGIYLLANTGAAGSTAAGAAGTVKSAAGTVAGGAAGKALKGVKGAKAVKAA